MDGVEKVEKVTVSLPFSLSVVEPDQREGNKDGHMGQHRLQTGQKASSADEKLQKFGKKKQAELVFRANDIFRDRSQVHYSVTDLYTRMNSSTSTQDYYMLSFSYRFDRIEKK